MPIVTIWKPSKRPSAFIGATALILMLTGIDGAHNPVAAQARMQQFGGVMVPMSTFQPAMGIGRNVTDDLQRSFTQSLGNTPHFDGQGFNISSTGNQGNGFGNQGNGFGNQGNGSGSQPNVAGNQGNGSGNQGNSSGNQSSSSGNQTGSSSSSSTSGSQTSGAGSTPGNLASGSLSSGQTNGTGPTLLNVNALASGCAAKGNSIAACQVAAYQCYHQGGDSHQIAQCVQGQLTQSAERGNDERMASLTMFCAGQMRPTKGCDKVANDCIAKLPGGSLSEHQMCVELETSVH
jgi:hypothetical protein